MSYPNVIADHNILCRIDSFSRLGQKRMGISCSNHDFRRKQAVVSDNTFGRFGNGNVNFSGVASVITGDNRIIVIFYIKRRIFGNAVFSQFYCVVTSVEDKFAITEYPPRVISGDFRFLYLLFCIVKESLRHFQYEFSLFFYC